MSSTPKIRKLKNEIRPTLFLFVTSPEILKELRSMKDRFYIIIIFYCISICLSDSFISSLFFRFLALFIYDDFYL